MKKTLKYLLLIIAFQGYGQELNLPVFTQYLADNDFVVSPTFAGIGNNFRVRLNGLSQWVGIKNAPQNQALYADIRIASRSGAGISAYNDRNGNTEQKGIKFSFAHHLILGFTTEQYLSLGVSYKHTLHLLIKFVTHFPFPFRTWTFAQRLKYIKANGDGMGTGIITC